MLFSSYWLETENVITSLKGGIFFEGQWSRIFMFFFRKRAHILGRKKGNLSVVCMSRSEQRCFFYHLKTFTDYSSQGQDLRFCLNSSETATQIEVRQQPWLMTPYLRLLNFLRNRGESSTFTAQETFDTFYAFWERNWPTVCIFFAFHVLYNHKCHAMHFPIKLRYSRPFPIFFVIIPAKKDKNKRYNVEPTTVHTIVINHLQ